MWADGWVSIDTETTGLDGSARIVEVAAVTFEGGKPVREWSTLLFPEGVDWENKNVLKALEVNKLTLAELRGKPSFADILPDLLVELAHPVLVAHNAEFDERMVNQELKRLGRESLKPQMLICTKNLANKLNGGRPGNRLEQVAQRFNIPQSDAHRAVVDARVCGLILAEMHRQALLPTNDEAMSSLCRTAASQWRGQYNR